MKITFENNMDGEVPIGYGYNIFANNFFVGRLSLLPDEKQRRIYIELIKVDGSLNKIANPFFTSFANAKKYVKKALTVLIIADLKKEI